MGAEPIIHIQYNPEHTNLFTTLHNQRMPRAGRFIARMLLTALLVMFVGLMFTPWVQTSEGQGTITALDPAQRPQPITAMIDGRIQEWLVRDGQHVKAGTIIARLVDNDPQLLQRLEGDRDAMRQKVEYAEIASDTARLDYKRQENLFRQGLASRKEYEKAKIVYKEKKAKARDARASFNKSQVQLSRLSTQEIIAPTDGMITNMRTSGTASFVKSGDRLADILPDNNSMAVELFISGLDAPLVKPNREVRMIFEGWPALQFSGWPETAVGTFRGRVLSVDPAASLSGKFRVLILPEPITESTPHHDGSYHWPNETYLRYGSKVQAWVLLDTVPLGFELWRQLNGFPPNNTDLIRKADVKK
ncbi:MAG: efflux RND transporter periplasmic adaptor subunit [Alphaproteobacteria bacterium]|nr:MAG: efflux RND transporter periplasmic adaptor subunit [Alphaproteobacteria bacterium]